MAWRPHFKPILFLALSFATFVHSQTPDLQLQSVTLPLPVIGRPYSAAIQVTGGTPPLRWELIGGKLPEGITLQPTIGTLVGTPTARGSGRFTIAVTDAGGKRLVHEFTLAVEDYLVALFQKGPSLNSNELSGVVEVKNSSTDNYDLTVIVVAVNQTGKAFALGYQHFSFPAQGDQLIPFSSTLPNGTYIVHVDAIAKITGRNLVRHTSLQTQKSITVNVNR